MLDINTNSHDRLYFNQQQNDLARSSFTVNSDLPNTAIATLNASGCSPESSFANFTASNIDQQTQIADFIVANAGSNLSFSAGDRVTGDADAQLLPQSQSTGVKTDPLTGMISASGLNFAAPGNSIFIPVLPDIPTPNGVYNSNYGYGLVNANAAVSRTLNRSPFPALPDMGGTNWALDVINAPEVWNQNITGNGIVVAVVDSGVDYTHPDLDGNIWRNPGEIAGNGIDDDRNGFVDDVRGWDFVDKDNDPMDRTIVRHGTDVAGAIAAERNNLGITGVAYNAKIMPVRVLNASIFGWPNDIADGIRYAADNGADVINVSLGNESNPLNEVNDAIVHANNKGSVVVMAAGNAGGIQPAYPARNADRWGIAAGSIDVRGRMADRSNRAGSRPLDYLVAPGVDIYSTTSDRDYKLRSGTSFATPHVAGVAALVLSANPTLTPAQVEYILTTTANRNGLTG